ncbi:hypothetical protein HF675_13345 [Serratia sp. JUb9]|uniref:hypothetical protein n=1 Tax=unclassified Serratia (in: enterobacteria) TaxID=2647522 RepID=UPI000CF64D02|nr:MULTISPECIES: hypothetical protein [unclassified Serratia (in: enterobacteria)]AVJ17226.1 hypothetical protein CLM71_08825 [Serratia sp. MYb239]QNK30637.1 hypothetical protein HF675_13345 [Serratia sp. JUb9]QPT15492.1 hypothetical protein I6G37_11330 [Serratia rubidaea]SQJ21713.1 Uncharacterised protein [Serratia rubidaea]
MTEERAKQIVNLIGQIVLGLVKEGRDITKDNILMQLEWRRGVFDDSIYREIYTQAIQAINADVLIQTYPDLYCLTKH